MTAVAEGTIVAAADDRLARRNTLVLAIGQALSGANNSVIVSTGAIVGSVLAPDPGLATLPISIMVLGICAGTVPVGILSRAFGRRFALQTGTVFGILCGLIACAAVLRGSFWLYNVGTFCAGLYAAAHLSYRFAATDTASDEFRPKAVAWVLAGGVAAGVLGPQLVIATKDAWQPHLFAATYLAQAAVALLAGFVLAFLQVPSSIVEPERRGGRSLAEIARMPRFIVAVACGVASYAMMNLMMTSAPLAMVGCGHSVTQATLGIQWHVLGMYAPSFITGSLILRFGVGRITGIGLVLMSLSAAVGLSGISVLHFWSALTLLGVGWNFAFIGATTMVTECHRPQERNKVQSFNDFLVFGGMAIGSFSSGQILAAWGWSAVNGVVFPVILAAILLLIGLSLRDRLRIA